MSTRQNVYTFCAVLLGCTLCDLEGIKGLRVVVTVSNSGKAVLESNIIFFANLVEHDTQGPDQNVYRFKWTNNAKRKQETVQTIGHDTSKMTEAFPSALCKGEGKYSMHVTVYRKLNDIMWSPLPVAENTTQFELTGMINGNLYLNQETGLKRRPEMFATGSKINLFAKVRDKFTAPKYIFSWHKESSGSFAQNAHPHESVMFNRTGDMYVGVGIVALVNTTNISGATIKKNVTGLFREFIQLKDPVRDLHVVASQNYTLGSLIVVNVTCTGTPIFKLWWNLTHDGVSNISCAKESNDCQGELKFKADQMGLYNVTLYVQNNVSLVTKNIKIELHKNVPPVPAYIPIFCIIIFLLVLFLVFCTHYLQHIKPRVETADFDFHYHSQHVPYTALCTLMHALRQIVSQDTPYAGRPWRLIWKRHNRPQVRSYGAINQGSQHCV